MSIVDNKPKLITTICVALATPIVLSIVFKIGQSLGMFMSGC